MCHTLISLHWLCAEKRGCLFRRIVAMGLCEEGSYESLCQASLVAHGPPWAMRGVVGARTDALEALCPSCEAYWAKEMGWASLRG